MYTHKTMPNNTKRVKLAHASNRMSWEMSRNGGNHQVDVVYQKRSRMTALDPQATNAEHFLTGITTLSRPALKTLKSLKKIGARS